MRRDEEDVRLYDRVARVEEQLGSKAVDQLRPRLEGEDGEARFTQLVQEHAQPDDVAVDIGTGAGVWLLGAVAPRVRQAIGIDYARGRFRFALQAKTQLGATNACFLLADGRRIPLRDGVADLVISRRGPWTENEQFFEEGCRVLSQGGFGMEIGIGALNAQELHEAFAERAQMHVRYTTDRDPMEESVALFRRHGLEPVVTESYVATEVFPSRDALVHRLDRKSVV